MMKPVEVRLVLARRPPARPGASPEAAGCLHGRAWRPHAPWRRRGLVRPAPPRLEDEPADLPPLTLTSSPRPFGSSRVSAGSRKLRCPVVSTTAPPLSAGTAVRRFLLTGGTVEQEWRRYAFLVGGAERLRPVRPVISARWHLRHLLPPHGHHCGCTRRASCCVVLGWTDGHRRGQVKEARLTSADLLVLVPWLIFGVGLAVIGCRVRSSRTTRRRRRDHR